MYASFPGRFRPRLCSGSSGSNRVKSSPLPLLQWGLCSMMVWLVAGVRAETLSTARETVFLILTGGSAAEASMAQPAVPSSQREISQGRRAQILAQQALIIQEVQQLGGKVDAQYQTLANAIKVQVPPGTADRLAALTGVKAVRPVRHFQRHTASSIPFIGAPEVWHGLTATGQGVRIGIIDSGVDYLHADFGGPGLASEFQNNDPSTIEPGTFPTPKVVGGWDFAGKDYDSSTSGADVPEPDPDPLDCSSDGHGTHVAGIAAGYGVLTNGNTYSGPYTSLRSMSAFRIGPGVAPEASLYALKIFGCSGTTSLVLDALERAADPNQDGDYSDRLDVVNLSLGSPFGFQASDDPEEAAVEQLAQLGSVVVISAGNSGNTFYIVSGPGTAPSAITVADSIDDSDESTAFRILSPASIVGNYQMQEGAFTVPLASSGPIEGEVVYAEPADGCGVLSNVAGVAGKIIMMDRGTCYFVDKVQQAQNAGALAVVVVNNAAGDLVTMSGEPSYEVRIPGIFISKGDGALLKNVLVEHPRVRLEPGLVTVIPGLADRLSSSSSRGPALPDSLLKPDIAAPGFNITSAKAGGGNLGVTYTGTSMAAPHISGAAALLRELHPAWSVEYIKAALLNTCERTHSDTGVAYPQSMTGAGRVNITRAAQTTVTVAAQDSGGNVSLNLGALSLDDCHNTNYALLIRNHGTQNESFSVVASNHVSETGFVVSCPVTSVTVGAGESATVTVRVEANPVLFDRSRDEATADQIAGFSTAAPFEVSGLICFGHPKMPLTLPFYGVVRSGSILQVPVRLLSMPMNRTAQTVDLTLAGTSAHPEPLVSVFQLGFTNLETTGISAGEAAANLLAGGAASDVGTATSFASSIVYFGIAVAKPMATPNGFHAQVTVEIDTNSDGKPDYALCNSTQGNADIGDISSPDSADDVMRAVLMNNSTGEVTADHFLNYFPPAERDTAVFDTRTLVLPVRAGALGLTSSHPKFRYRVVTTGAYAYYGPQVDTSAWVTFDAARPYADSTQFGIKHTPFFALSARTMNVRVSLDEGASAQNGLTTKAPGGLLLLYHMNSTSAPACDLVKLTRDPAEVTPIVLLPSTVSSNRMFQLSWTSSVGKLYRVRMATSLSPAIYQTVAENINASPPVNTYREQLSGAGERYFRIEQQ